MSEPTRTSPGERLSERLSQRLARRPRVGLSPAFYGRVGVAHPPCDTSIDADADAVREAFTYLSGEGWRRHMNRLALSRWWRERRQASFTSRLAGRRTAERTGIGSMGANPVLAFPFSPSLSLSDLVFPKPVQAQDDEDQGPFQSPWNTGPRFETRTAESSPWRITPYTAARVARPMERVSARLTVARAAADPLQQALAEATGGLRGPRSRSLARTVVETIDEPAERSVKIRRVLRRVAPRVRTIVEDALPAEGARPVEVARNRMGSGVHGKRGLRPAWYGRSASSRALEGAARAADTRGPRAARASRTPVSSPTRRVRRSRAPSLPNAASRATSVLRSSASAPQGDEAPAGQAEPPPATPWRGAARATARLLAAVDPESGTPELPASGFPALDRARRPRSPALRGLSSSALTERLAPFSAAPAQPARARGSVWAASRDAAASSGIERTLGLITPPSARPAGRGTSTAPSRLPFWRPVLGAGDLVLPEPVRVPEAQPAERVSPWSNTPYTPARTVRGALSVVERRSRVASQLARSSFSGAATAAAAAGAFQGATVSAVDPADFQSAGVASSRRGDFRGAGVARSSAGEFQGARSATAPAGGFTGARRGRSAIDAPFRTSVVARTTSRAFSGATVARQTVSGFSGASVFGTDRRPWSGASVARAQAEDFRGAAVGSARAQAFQGAVVRRSGSRPWSGASSRVTSPGSWSGSSLVRTGRGVFVKASTAGPATGDFTGATSRRGAGGEFEGAGTAATPSGDFTGSRVAEHPEGRFTGASATTTGRVGFTGARKGVGPEGDFRGAETASGRDVPWSGASVAEGQDRPWSGAGVGAGRDRPWVGAGVGEGRQVHWTGAVTGEGRDFGWSGAGVGAGRDFPWSGAGVGAGRHLPWSGAGVGAGRDFPWVGAAYGEGPEATWTGAATGVGRDFGWSGAGVGAARDFPWAGAGVGAGRRFPWDGARVAQAGERAVDVDPVAERGATRKVWGVAGEPTLPEQPSAAELGQTTPVAAQKVWHTTPYRPATVARTVARAATRDLVGPAVGEAAVRASERVAAVARASTPSALTGSPMPRWTPEAPSQVVVAPYAGAPVGSGPSRDFEGAGKGTATGRAWRGAPLGTGTAATFAGARSGRTDAGSFTGARGGEARAWSWRGAGTGSADRQGFAGAVVRRTASGKFISAKAAQAEAGPFEGAGSHRTAGAEFDGASATRTPGGSWRGAASERTPSGTFAGAGAWRTPEWAWQGAQGVTTPGRTFTGAGLGAPADGDFAGAPTGTGAAGDFHGAGYGPGLDRDFDGGGLGAGAPWDWRGAATADAHWEAFAGARAGRTSGGVFLGTRRAWTPYDGVVVRPGAGSRPDLRSTLGGVSQEEAAEGVPGWAVRATGRSFLKTTGDLVQSLAEARDPMEVIQVILERGDRLAVSRNLPTPVAEVIRQIRATAAQELVSPRRQAERAASAQSPSAGVLRGRSPRRLASTTRVVRGGRRPAASSVGAGGGLPASRLQGLAKRLQDLIHLVQVEDKLFDAQRQVRMAAEGTEPAGGAGGGADEAQSKGRSQQLEALKREVLTQVNKEMELRSVRGTEGSDGNW